MSLHNVRFLVRIGEQARAAVLEGRFMNWRHDWIERYTRGNDG